MKLEANDLLDEYRANFPDSRIGASLKHPVVVSEESYAGTSPIRESGPH